MKTLTSPLLFILILVSAYTNHVHEILSSCDYREKTPISALMMKEITDVQKDNNPLDKMEREIRNEQTGNQYYLIEELKKAKKYLKCLLRERNVLEGDFYGINLTAYRYVNIFDRLGYIRYRIMQIEKKIKKTKLKISELKKEF